MTWNGLQFFFAPFFLPAHKNVYPSKWRVDGSQRKAMPCSLSYIKCLSCLVSALSLRSSSSSNVIDWGCTSLCRKLYYFINVQTHPFTDHIWWILENISLCIVTSYLNNNYIVLTSVTPNHVDLTIFVQPLNIGPHQWDIRLAGWPGRASWQYVDLCLLWWSVSGYILLSFYDISWLCIGCQWETLPVDVM